MVQSIEFCCTANAGRSPVAEAIAREHLRKQNALDMYNAKSSGVYRDAIRNGVISESDKRKTVDTVLSYALHDKFLTREEIYKFYDAIRDINVPNRKEIIDEVFNKTMNKFSREEHAYRTIALRRLELEGKIKKESEQTIADPNVIASFGMEPWHAKAIKEIYRDGNPFPPAVISLGPIIAPLGEYVTGNPNLTIKSTFGGTKEEYFETIQVLEMCISPAIDKVINHYESLSI
ncbi:MAG: hypothetical protein PHT54_00190 [Candidatus Nanoarchaeia archaeon]|nr:hypothetical protein [Candidatus Nanoarchaeia archaeon]